MLKIYAKDTSKINEDYFIMKEFRADILVQIDDCFYEINCFTAYLIKQESDEEGNAFLNIPNLFIVKDVSFKSIVEAVIYNFQQGYFDSLKNNSDINLTDWCEVFPKRSFIEFKK